MTIKLPVGFTHNYYDVKSTSLIGDMEVKRKWYLIRKRQITFYIKWICYCLSHTKFISNRPQGSVHRFLLLHYNLKISTWPLFFNLLSLQLLLLKSFPSLGKGNSFFSMILSSEEFSMFFHCYMSNFVHVSKTNTSYLIHTISIQRVSLLWSGFPLIILDRKRSVGASVEYSP